MVFSLKAVAKVKWPSAVNGRSSVPLFCRTTVPESPDTVPPTVYVGTASLTQFTSTFVTSAVTVPLPLFTVQVWPIK